MLPCVRYDAILAASNYRTGRELGQNSLEILASRLVTRQAFCQKTVIFEAQFGLSIPAQALSYKIGELTILELRAEARKRLGARLDLRAFHDAILEEGHLPMSILRQRMQAWIEAQSKLTKL